MTWKCQYIGLTAVRQLIVPKNAERTGLILSVPLQGEAAYIYPDLSLPTAQGFMFTGPMPLILDKYSGLRPDEEYFGESTTEATALHIMEHFEDPTYTGTQPVRTVTPDDQHILDRRLNYGRGHQ